MAPSASAAVWWRAIVERDSPFREVLDPVHHQLLPIKGESLRQRIFDEAFEAFRTLAPETLPAIAKPSLADPHYERFLFLHMAALVYVMGGKVEATGLIARILAHEEKFWIMALGLERNDLALESFYPHARRIVAGLTLRGETSFEMLAGFVESEGVAKEFSYVLRNLYPGGRDPHHIVIRGLEPDLLGEALVLRTLSEECQWEKYLDRIFMDTDGAVLMNGFIVLGRISLYHRDEGEGWLRHLLRQDVPKRALPALIAALSLSGVSAFASLGRYLAEVCREQGTAKLAAAFEPLLPEHSVSLGEVGVWCLETLLRHLPQEDSEESLKEKARLLNNLGNRYSDLGVREAALEAAQEAVAIRRELASARPDAFLPDLPMSLNNLGNRHSDLGHRDAALAAAQEAVGYYQVLAEALPAAFMQNFRVSVQNLARFLQEAERSIESHPTMMAAIEFLKPYLPDEEAENPNE